jgi:hypothetical protein
VTAEGDRIDMVHELHTALLGASWARPESPEKVWKMLLANVADVVAERDALRDLIARVGYTVLEGHFTRPDGTESRFYLMPADGAQ